MLSPLLAVVPLALWIASGDATPGTGITRATPSSNLLDYLSSSSGSGGCATVVQGGYLVFPNARIDSSPNGFIDCSPRLRFSGIPAGHRFSITSASVAGYARLDRGSYVEKIQVQISRLGGMGDTGSGTRSNLYGQGGTGYDGQFNTSVALSRSSSTGAPCSSSVTMDLELFIALSHEQLVFDDTSQHAGSIGGDRADQKVRVGLDTRWEDC
ncbi:hypothetical protein GQ53DRAFT_832553 [Thozetella sp. PMI_491]|nr:hypothetical protein GQ53DRAFT_832553 [Thozetella sp. PMI_491]